MPSPQMCIRDSGVREVGKVQGNAVAFLKPDGKLSWLWWPKAKDVQVEENAFTVLQNGCLLYTSSEPVAVAGFPMLYARKGLHGTDG